MRPCANQPSRFLLQLKLTSLKIWKIFLSLVSSYVRHCLKSGPDARDSETRDSETLRPGTLGPVTLGLWEPGTRYPDTQDSGNRPLELGTCYPETQILESKTLRTELMAQIPSIPTRATDCSNFNYEA